jgi:NAD(P)-dependent dehydrogenase (short-subunit alcohol dehydrogenase family)
MDKVVLITGVSEGIGRATALEFVRRGARVVLGGRNDEAG